MTLRGKVRKKLPLICSLITVLFAFIGVCEGADLGDTTYSMGNFENFRTQQGDWLYATYLSNLTGFILFKLTGGRLLYFNLLTRFIPALCSVTVMASLKKQIPYPILFLGQIFALGLCWCPTAILYNYLSYFCLSMAAILLFTADNENKKKRHVLAGLILGVALFVRISNLLYCALIVFVICSDILDERKKDIAGDVANCVAGYLAGLITAFVILVVSRIAVGGGADAAAKGLKDAADWALSLLSGGSGESGGYSMGDMLKLILDAYVFAAKRALFMVAGIAAGTVMFMIKKESFVKIKKFLYMAGVLLLLVFYYKKGVITRSYYNNGSIYGVCGIFILTMLISFIWCLADKRIEKKDRKMAIMGLLILLIAPLGTNNHFYALINQMFIIAPIAVYLIIRLIRLSRGSAICFPYAAMMISFMAVLLFQSVMFKCFYAFGDGEDGVKRIYTIEEGRLKGMRTNWQRGEALDALTAAAGGMEGKLISYGNLPGLYYVLEKEPALSTLWPDLDSFSYTDMKDDVDGFMASGEEAMVIIKQDAIDFDDEKFMLLADLIKEKGYVTGYEGEDHVMYLPGGAR